MIQEFKVGDIAPYITKIQRILNEMLGIHMVVDGAFGPVMRDAVLTCQTQHNLKPTGTYSPGVAAICDPLIQTKYLTEEAFQKAATLLNIPKTVVKAIQKVETSGIGFLDDGRPTILFERHIFRKRLMAWMKASSENLKKIYEQLHMKFVPGTSSISEIDLAITYAYSNIYNISPGGYMGKEKEYERLALASSIDESTALVSASWGLFQIMGFNYGLCGYNTVAQYVADSKASEQNHLSAFANFIKSNPPMLLDLQSRNWQAFSLKYNGPKETDYHSRLQAAVTYFELHPE